MTKNIYLIEKMSENKTLRPIKMFYLMNNKQFREFFYLREGL